MDLASQPSRPLQTACQPSGSPNWLESQGPLPVWKQEVLPSGTAQCGAWSLRLKKFLMEQDSKVTSIGCIPVTWEAPQLPRSKSTVRTSTKDRSIYGFRIPATKSRSLASLRAALKGKSLSKQNPTEKGMMVCLDTYSFEKSFTLTLFNRKQGCWASNSRGKP